MRSPPPTTCTSGASGAESSTGKLSDTYSPTGEGKLFFTMMAAFAELERDLLHERTLAGLAAARAQGRTGGRPTVMDADKLAAAQARRAKGETPTQIAAAQARRAKGETPTQIAAAQARRAKGETPTQIAAALNVSRASVYRHLAHANEAAAAHTE